MQAALTLPAMTLFGTRTEAATLPAANWEKTSLQQAGLKAAAIEALELKLCTLPTTSFMIVSGGKISYSYGDIAEVSYLASARKSILSMMFGTYDANGTINLDRTMGELGIDEPDGLLPIEKTAKIRDLLIASSGVYHAAGSPGDDPNKIERGSKQPGTFFHYNNWDFNVIGAIFEKLTHKTVFNALAQDLAKPLQLQDYTVGRQRMMGFENQSKYLAYHLFLSARDMARLGLLMARGGNWNGQQIVPANWVKESTAQHVKPESVGRGGELGYGYLWWVPATRAGPEWKGSYMMSGQFGQFVLVMPAIDTVIVHRRAVTDEYAVQRNLGKTTFEPTRVESPAFLQLADMVVAARS